MGSVASVAPLRHRPDPSLLFEIDHNILEFEKHI
jgi:hypothetical protein